MVLLVCHVVLVVWYFCSLFFGLRLVIYCFGIVMLWLGGFVVGLVCGWIGLCCGWFVLWLVFRGLLLFGFLVILFS